jgi:hypothetical protein
METALYGILLVTIQSLPSLHSYPRCYLVSCHWYLTNVKNIVTLITYIFRFFQMYPTYRWAGIAQSVYRMATGWKVRGSNPGGGEIFRTCPDRPWAPPASYTMSTGSFPRVANGRGATLTPHPLLAPRLRKE